MACSLEWYTLKAVCMQDNESEPIMCSMNSPTWSLQSSVDFPVVEPFAILCQSPIPEHSLDFLPHLET